MARWQGEEALSSFLRAYELDACYTFAGLHAFDLLLEHGTVEATREVLERLLEASSQSSVLIRALRFAVPGATRRSSVACCNRCAVTAAWSRPGRKC